MKAFLKLMLFANLLLALAAAYASHYEALGYSIVGILFAVGGLIFGKP